MAGERVSRLLTRSLQTHLSSALPELLKEILVDPTRQNNSGNPLMSPLQNSLLRNSVPDAQDSLHRFVETAGQPKSSSTPLRTHIRKPPPLSKQVTKPADVGFEMPPASEMPKVIVDLPVPVGSTKHPIAKPVKNHQPISDISVIAEGNEDEPSRMEQDEEVDTVARAPLKPIPSRSAPVKSSKSKVQQQAEKVKSRSRKARTPSSRKAEPTDIRVSTKVNQGRVETKVCNAILQDAHVTKARSVKRKQIDTEPPVKE